MCKHFRPQASVYQHLYNRVAFLFIYLFVLTLFDLFIDYLFIYPYFIRFFIRFVLFIDFYWLYSILLKYLFHSNLNTSGRSHVGSLRRRGKMFAREVFHTLPHISVLFITSLIHAIGYKMATRLVFWWLWNAVLFNKRDEKSSDKN